MPTNYARFLVGRDRTVKANRQLGWFLAFVAGAINAGGFLAVQQYTSHVTGIVSAVADNLVLGQLGLVVDGIVAVLTFMMGAMCSAILVNFARRKAMASEYATTTDCMRSGLSCRSSAIAGNAVLTMVASSVCMKKPIATSHSRRAREGGNRCVIAQPSARCRRKKAALAAACKHWHALLCS